MQFCCLVPAVSRFSILSMLSRCDCGTKIDELWSHWLINFAIPHSIKDSFENERFLRRWKKYFKSVGIFFHINQFLRWMNAKQNIEYPEVQTWHELNEEKYFSFSFQLGFAEIKIKAGLMTTYGTTNINNMNNVKNETFPWNHLDDYLYTNNVKIYSFYFSKNLNIYCSFHKLYF